MASKKHREPLRKTRQGIETREVKPTATKEPYISISFKYFQDTNTYPAQSLSQWETDGMLPAMLRSLIFITQENITQLQGPDKKIALYKKFPDKAVNEFTLPTSLNEYENWGTIRNVGGQKARIAGFLRDNIFYIVYLDKHHKFYKSTK